MGTTKTPVVSCTVTELRSCIRCCNIGFELIYELRGEERSIIMCARVNQTTNTQTHTRVHICTHTTRCTPCGSRMVRRICVISWSNHQPLCVHDSPIWNNSWNRPVFKRAHLHTFILTDSARVLTPPIATGQNNTAQTRVWAVCRRRRRRRRRYPTVFEGVFCFTCGQVWRIWWNLDCNGANPTVHFHDRRAYGLCGAVDIWGRAVTGCFFLK